MPSPPRLPFRNTILGRLPAQELKKLQPHLKPLAFRRRAELHRAGQTVETIYFLEDGICSIVATMKDGSTVEVGIVGRDNFVGLAAVLGTGHSANHSFIQIPGYGNSIDAKIMLDLCHGGSDELLRALKRGIQGLITQTAQTAACNRIHELEERLSRWILMCHDRMQVNVLPITHEFLAMMLGTRRSTVTVAAGILQKAGLIEHSRGNVTVVNRKGLEAATCECYQVVRDEYIRLGLL